jgi:hypothetical protein
MKRSVRFCRMTHEGVFVDGHLVAPFASSDLFDNLTAFYKQKGCEYPKFYKMDLLSKVAFLSVEILKEMYPRLTESADDSVGLLFANSESSSATDLKFRESYEKELLPSPSLFVYTLPNIAMGEVAIRNKWYGAQMFAVFPNFAPAFFAEYGSLMCSNGAGLVIGAWLDVRDRLDSLFFVADGVLPLQKEAFQELLEGMYGSH